MDAILKFLPCIQFVTGIRNETLGRGLYLKWLREIVCLPVRTDAILKLPSRFCALTNGCICYSVINLGGFVKCSCSNIMKNCETIKCRENVGIFCNTADHCVVVLRFVQKNKTKSLECKRAKTSSLSKL